MCAVSDHLAAVSLFDSDQWMACLEHFSGWTDTSLRAEQNMRELVSQLRLRPLVEPGDIDSPLLRSQIDEQYLRAMASARAQMAGTGSENERPINKETLSTTANQTPEPGSKKNGRSQSSTVSISTMVIFLMAHGTRKLTFRMLHLGSSPYLSSSERILSISRWTSSC